MRALIVEDEVLAAMHLEATLEDLGITSIGIAADQPNALRLAAEAPDLAFVDLNLRDGFTGPRIAATLADQGVAILFVTANPGQLGAARSLAADVIDKPFDDARVVSAVRSVAAARGLQPGV